jgi:hypothetical protein
MQRRSLVKYLAIGGPIVTVGGGYLWLSAERDYPQLTIPATLQKLQQLASGDITKTGTWNPYQVFNHCAQSVEFSITGFPQNESALFQNTAGALAFSAA